MIMPDLEQDEGPKADLDLCTGPKDAYVVEVELVIPLVPCILVLHYLLCCVILSIITMCTVYSHYFTTVWVLKQELGYS